jgi:hypothetical protein
MNHIEILKTKLLHLEKEINSRKDCNIITFDQQSRTAKHMSFIGGNGRINITPCSGGYDIALSGQSLEKQMYHFMQKLCGRKNDGYKQTKPLPHVPFWRVDNFELVKTAVLHYAKTRK